MSADLSRLLNALGLLVIGAVLTMAFIDQVWFGELPCPLCILQRAGLILTPARHERHHTAPFDGWFCISSGLLDGLLMRIGLWERLNARFQGRS